MPSTTPITIDQLDEDFQSRYWPKVDRSSGPDSCWIWSAAINNAGYGRIGLNYRMVLAHRVAWVLSGHTLHDGFVIDHTCENRRCVNPSHLREVTNRENGRSSAVGSRNSSGYRGVTWNGRSKRWRADVYPSGPDGYTTKHIPLGEYRDKADAVRAVAIWWWIHQPDARNVGIENLTDAEKSHARLNYKK